METLTVSKEKKLFTPCRAFVGKRAKPILHCGLIKEVWPVGLHSTSHCPLTHPDGLLYVFCFFGAGGVGDVVLQRGGGGVKKEVIMETDTHVSVSF